MATPDETPQRADVVVIGSGAGGAAAAVRLAEAGLEVVVLEAGERIGTRAFDGDAAALLPRLMHAAVSAESGMEVYAGRCVGGSTVVNDALCWRPPAEVLAQWRRQASLPGLTEAALAPHVEEVWRDLHVSPTRRSHLNRNAHQLERGAARLGWAAEAMPRNVRGCASLGLCNIGCPTGAKQSMLVSYLPRAERAGARILPRTRAERIERTHNGWAVVATRAASDGRAEAVMRIEAPRICVAAGVLATPALLQRSGIGGDRAGTDVQFHSSVYVTARFPEVVHGYYGPTMSYAVSEFSDVNGHDGPGFMIENVTVSPVTTAGSLPGFGAEHERVMAQLPYLARSLVVLRDHTRGQVDARGGVHYEPLPIDLERVGHGIRAIARLYLAAGAEEVLLPVNGLAPIRSEADLRRLEGLHLDPRGLSLYYAVHLFGGAAMNGQRGRGVCDEAGECWDAPGVYVTDAASLPGNTGVNPQVTILANALRIAEGVAARGLGKA